MGHNNRPISDVNSESNKGEPAQQEYNLQKISAMLDQLKSCLDLPVNFKPRIPEVAMQPRSVSR